MDAPRRWEQRHYRRSRGGGNACRVCGNAHISERSTGSRDGNIVTIVIDGATTRGEARTTASIAQGGRGQRERRSRETLLGKEGYDGSRDAASDEELKRTRRRTPPLAVRRRGEATKTTTGGDVGG